MERSPLASDVQGLQVRHTRGHERWILFQFDEVVLYATSFCGRKYCLPIDDALAQGSEVREKGGVGNCAGRTSLGG
jgi:hypothetical protein